MKKLVLLGASGCLGQQTVDIVRQHPDDFEIIALSVGLNVDFLKEYLKDNKPQAVCVEMYEDYLFFKEQYKDIEVYYGDEGLISLTSIQCDLVVNNLQGFVGFLPTINAIRHHSNIALANKETLVAGGIIVMKEAKENNVEIMPLDSEHTAIYQCLLGNKRNEISRIIITASGGSLRDLSRDELKDVTVERALTHPNWSMGEKITIDSSTMMNKGFEILEAHWLFDLDYDRIDVVQHRQSVIHSMVEYVDHSVIAQLAVSDMRICIQYALSFPERIDNSSDSLDLIKYGTLTFEKMDYERFPLLALAYKVGRMGGNMGAIMNGANEMAVNMFLNRECSYLDIENGVFAAVENAQFIENPTVEDIISSDRWAQNFVRDYLKR